MNLFSIDTGLFKLDGGAMFGIIPKTIWNKINPADEKNLCTWAMRSLLIEEGDQLILIDTGLGDKQSEKFFSYYEPHGEDTLIGSLNKHGFSPDDVTDVILTHLHFDHCGGAVQREPDGKLIPAFKNATYWSDEVHWNWAVTPNDREKGSFLKENFMPIQENGQLRFLKKGDKVFPGFDFDLVNGHTEAMTIPYVRYKDKTIVYMADLIPSAGHIPLPYIMGYDIRALTTLDEKKAFLPKAWENDYILFFEHDPEIECCTLKKTEKGIRMDKALRLAEVI